MNSREHSIPTPAPSAASVEVDGETVLLDQSTGALHLLNDAGAAIWSRVDGSRTVGTIVAELSDTFGAEPTEVEGDVHEFLTRLRGLGLIEPANGRTAAVGPAQQPLEARVGTSWNLDTVWVDWYTAQVVDALRARGIEAIVLKGPAIRSWLYGNDPGQRGYIDADLLVEAAKLRAAAAVLSDLDFERARSVGMERISVWADTWRRHTDGAVVDLHQTLHGCEYSRVDPWPILRATAVAEEVGGTTVLLPSIPARALQLVLVSPADRPWRRWDDLDRVLQQLSAAEWREAAALAASLGVARQFGYRLSQSEAGARCARRIGIETAPRWWLRWEADPGLRWAALLAELPGWRARIRLVGQLMLPPAGYSPGSWARHVVALLPAAIATLLRSVRRPHGSV